MKLITTSTTTSLAALPAAQAHPDVVVLKRLPDEVREEAANLEMICKKIKLAGKVMPACKIHQEAAAMSAQRLRVLFYAWKAQGITALINHNKCGGCGLPGCGGKKGSRLHPLLVHEWLNRAGSSDKNGYSEAYETLLDDLHSGKHLPGIGFWTDLWIAIHPTRSHPDTCPWHLHNPPPGWSLANFMRMRPKGADYTLERKGLAAATLALPQVSLNLGNLRPLEALVFDDHRLDFMVFAQGADGKWQLVELWGLFVMDLATRTVIASLLRPRLAREDGTKEGFTHRDMQHLIARVLSRFGYPVRHTMTLIVENAAAAVSQYTETLLERLTDGQVKVHRTGVHAGDFRISGFPEKWGNPKGKAWLESWFNPLDIAVGNVKGQLGSNYTVAPGDRDSRIRVSEKVLPILDVMTEDEIKGLTLGFEFAADAQRIIDHAIHRLNTRTDHKCKDFRHVEFFRWSDSDPEPKPVLLTDCVDARMRKDVEDFLNLPPAAKAGLLDRYGIRRQETPMERFMRLWDGQNYQAISPEVYGDLYMDLVIAEYAGGNVLDLAIPQGRKQGKLKMRFQGSNHLLEHGMKVHCRFDADRPHAGIWLRDERGRDLGYMSAAERGDWGDVDALQEQLKARTKAQAELINRVRRRTLTPEVMQKRITEHDDNMTAFSAYDVQPSAPVSKHEESTSLVAAVQSVKPKQKPRYKRTPKPAEPTDTTPGADGFSFE